MPHLLFPYIDPFPQRTSSGGYYSRADAEQDAAAKAQELEWQREREGWNESEDED